MNAMLQYETILLVFVSLKLSSVVSKDEIIDLTTIKICVT